MPIDPTPFLTVRPAPCAVFDRLAEREGSPRFWVGDGESGWRPVTWGEYAEAIRDVAMVCGQTLQPGDRAAIFGHNSVAWATAAMAIQAVGGVMVPIYPASTAEQAAYVMQHSGAKMLFVAGREMVQRALASWDALSRVETIVVMDDTDPCSIAMPDKPSAAAIEAKFVHWSTVRARGAEAASADPDALARHLDAIDVEGPALMLYTSGSTGRPKGVPLTHHNVGTNGADWLRNNASLIPDDAVDLLWLPMSHIFGFGELSFGNLLGWTSYLSTPADVLADLPRVRPHVFMSVPAYWDKLAKTAKGATTPAERRRALDAATGGRLQFCLSGGAGLDRSVKELFLECGRLILEGYGLTECAPTLTLNRPDDFRFDSVGKPIASVQLRLAEDGEILARGPNVFSGYHEDPEATAAAFTDDGWFRTGDLGRWTEDGFLQIVGRKKEILVTAGGKNVAPGNIETRFSKEPLVRHAVVYGDGKKYLVVGLWLESNATEALTRREIEDALQDAVDRVNDGLARFEQVKKFIVFDEPLSVAAGLLTSTLKLRRKKIYETFGPRFEELYA